MTRPGSVQLIDKLRGPHNPEQQLQVAHCKVVCVYLQHFICVGATLPIVGKCSHVKANVPYILYFIHTEVHYILPARKVTQMQCWARMTEVMETIIIITIILNDLVNTGCITIRCHSAILFTQHLYT